jgi:hypothetical protein
MFKKWKVELCLKNMRYYPGEFMWKYADKINYFFISKYQKFYGKYENGK